MLEFTRRKKKQKTAHRMSLSLDNRGPHKCSAPVGADDGFLASGFALGAMLGDQPAVTSSHGAERSSPSRTSRLHALRLDHGGRLRRAQEIYQRLRCLGTLGATHDSRRKDNGVLKITRQRADNLNAGDRNKEMQLPHADLGLAV